MTLEQIDRMNMLILAKTVFMNRTLYQASGEVTHYLKRLNNYQVFTVGELAAISGTSPYKVRKAIGTEELKGRSGINPRHLDHLIRMVGSVKFTELHIRSLLDDGATFAALSRVTGYSERRLRRMERGKLDVSGSSELE